MSGRNGVRRAARLVPNGLTILRFLVALSFPVLPIAWRLPSIVLAALSDVLDGFLARRLRTAGPTGALLDGAADKVFGVVVLGTLTVEGAIRPWQLVLLLARDIAVALIAAYVAARREWWAFGRMSARFLGKAATVVVFALVIALLAVPDLRPVLMWLAMSAAAGVDYMAALVRALPDGDEAGRSRD